MATPPTYVNTYAVLPGTTTTPQSTGAVVNGNSGDIIGGTVIGWSDSGNDNFTITSSPAETFTEGTESSASTANDVWVQPVTASLTAARSGLNITTTRVTGDASTNYGQLWSQWRDSAGVGATQVSPGNGQSAPSVTITTQYDNSAIFYVVANWSDDANVARTHRTPSGGSTPVEIGHYNSSTIGSATWAYVLDAGAAGAKVVGLSAPTGQDSLVMAIEIRGTVAIGPAFDDATFDSGTFYTSDVTSVSKTYDSTWNVSATTTTPVSKTYANTWNLNSQVAKTYVSTWNLSSQVSKAYAQTWNTKTTVSKTYANAWNINGSVSKAYAGTWNLSAQIAKTYAQIWNVKATLSKTYAGIWNVGTSLNKAYANTWNTRSAVSKAYSQIWNVAGALTTVGKTYDHTWGVSTAVSKTYACTWNVKVPATAMYSVDWNARASIAKTSASTWNVASNVTANYYTITGAIGITPPTAATTDGSAVNLGTEFYVTSAAWATKIRWWQPTTNSPSSSTRTVGIYRVDSDTTGTLVAGPFTSVPVGSGWQNVALTDALALTPNQRYRVVVLHPSGQYASTSSTFIGADYVAGPLVVPMTSNATGNDNGSFNYGSSLSFTTGSFSNTYYWSDVEVSDTNPSGLSKVTKTAASTWAIASDKTFSFWPSDRSGWNSTPGTVYNDPNTFGGSWGLIFAVSGSCEIGGVRWYAPVAKSGAHLFLGDGDSGVVYHDQDNYEISVGWNEIVFDTPYVASPGVTYKIMLWMPGNQNYSYTDDNRWTTGDNRAVGNIYSLVSGPTFFAYNQNEPTTSIPTGTSGTPRWAAMDVIEVLPAAEELDTSFGATVALENAKPGSPSTGWMITGAGDIGNIGYTGKYHYDKAVDTTVDFHCHGPGTKIDIYRLGYYQGHGARKVAQLTNTATTQGNASTIANSNGGIEFNWSTTATWTIPSDALSGFYFAVYRNPGETNASWIPFVIADRDRNASMAYKTSDFTWYGAYNYCGDLGSILTGKSVYGSGGPLGNIATRHFVGSYHRPLVTREGIPQTYWMNSESSTIMFLEEQGIDVKYTSCIGLDQGTTGLTNINMLLSSGHDEYWSDGMTNNIQTLRDSEDINLVFMTGNENFWRVFWDNTNKRMTCRKDTMSGPDTHVAGVPFIDEANWTGTWRDTRWSLRRPENETTGTYFEMNGVMDKTLVVDAATYGSHTAWRNTTVASGTNLSLPRVVGFEADSYMPTKPVGSYSLLAAQVINIDGSKADANGENYNLAGNLNYGIIAQRFNNNVVVGFGTCQWQWALIGTHDRTATTPNINARQMTLNLLADLGAPPTTTTTGLVTPTPQSLDNYGLATTTPITKTYANTWNTRANVSKTYDNTWNINAAVAPKSYANTWNVRSVTSKVYAGTWNVRAFTSKGYANTWNLRSIVQKTYSPAWDVNSLASVNKTYTITWNTRATVAPATNANTWIVREVVNKAAVNSWTVREPLSKVSSSTWTVRSLITSTNANSWDVLARVAAKSYTNTWTARAFVTAATSVLWNARARITKSYQNLWDTEATGSVSSTYAVNWNVRSVTAKSYAQTWNVRTALSTSKAGTWNIRALANKSYLQTWNVRALVLSVNTSTWDTRVVISKASNFTWSVRSPIGNVVNFTWNIRSLVLTETPISWSTLELVTDQLPITWDIFVLASKGASTQWAISRQITRGYTNNWIVRENNKWYVKTATGIVSYTLVGVWDGTQVVAI